jgi:C_GCAxxG_C_C family probable redox protein
VNRIETSVSRFAEGFNCSQAVFSAYAEGIDYQTALKVAAGFGGGMGRLGGICGAVTGAFMVLGLTFATASPDPSAKERVYARISDFANRFRARNGSLACRNLVSV